MTNPCALPIRSLALGAGLILLTAACGDDSTESVIEEIIEQQGGGDVDLDLDLDGDGNGGFSIETEEGGITVDDDGNFVVTGEDGEVITGEAGSDGDFSIESDDGELSVNQGTELPSEWPADIVKPAGLAIQSSSVIGVDDEVAITLLGSAGTDPAAFVDNFSAALISSGFEQTANFEGQGNTTRILTNGTWGVSIGATGTGDDLVTVTLFKES
ncbi:MAG: hypothetical protein KUG57_06635 [Ilumatobacteraceae bacterium]|nr:hypothetical protein [Ilumatobacteraceae bacterium]